MPVPRLRLFEAGAPIGACSHRIILPTKTHQAPNRWLIASAGIVVMLCLGTVYSWSLFSRPLAAGFQWSSLRVSMVFAVNIFSLGWGAVCGGRWQDRAGPRIVSLTGVALWGLGNLLAGLESSPASETASPTSRRWRP